ncbi:hypothetical protein PFICI_04615 [Pestalotiopsis fici W106-1]|uniref:Major facilitator superfamily (MFS) profile domain-containing protein n=1 Tax=Pestalotiopsis fici (strain W106-1 / CGMCC3.15140) TaxID=1229662 RepID=W3X9Q1_PESFW|nr:uncharacterized protein PFICI_04615 [Pestalotiopsis fici W106-1]ETS82739.1 hypothetical protein PFICI_04615 [Pestalotiopsis fici W106-1]
MESKIKSADKQSTVPDGGLQAWLQVLGAFFLFFNTWGIINSFGVFQTYYEQDLLASSDSSDISWIGSLQSFFIMFLGFITGPVYDAGYFYHLLLVGSFLVTFGHMMLSLCTVFWQVLLAQSFCIGLGAGCLFVPGVAILSQYFSAKLSLAVGLAASGASVGGVVYPVAFRQLQQHLGFPWAVRIIGFVALGGLSLSNVCMRTRTLPLVKRKMVDWSAFTELPYLLFSAGLFVAFLGAYTPFYYIQLFAEDRSITNSDLAFYLIAILNAASTVGRIVPNFVADKLGPFNMMVPCAIICGILILTLLAVEEQGPLLACTALYGVFSGSFVSLSPSILVTLSPNLGVVGTRMGMCFTVMGLSLLIGTPVAGAILRSGFNDVWIYGGVLTTTGGVLIGLARAAYTKGRWWSKV